MYARMPFASVLTLGVCIFECGSCVTKCDECDEVVTSVTKCDECDEV